MAEFKCKQCGYEESVSDSFALRKARCPKCKRISRISESYEVELFEALHETPKANCSALERRIRGQATECPLIGSSFSPDQSSQNSGIARKY